MYEAMIPQKHEAYVSLLFCMNLPYVSESKMYLQHDSFIFCELRCLFLSLKGQTVPFPKKTSWEILFLLWYGLLIFLLIWGFISTCCKRGYCVSDWASIGFQTEELFLSFGLVQFSHFVLCNCFDMTHFILNGV